jgi:hypothetical protein
MLFQQTFSDVAMFFRDIYGGDKIGVVWKQECLQATQFKVCALGKPAFICCYML